MNKQRRAQVSTQQVHVVQVGRVTPPVCWWAWQIQETHSRLRSGVPADESVDRTDVFLSQLVGVIWTQWGAIFMCALRFPSLTSFLSLPVQSDHLVPRHNLHLSRNPQLLQHHAQLCLLFHAQTAASLHAQKETKPGLAPGPRVAQHAGQLQQEERADIHVTPGVRPMR